MRAIKIIIGSVVVIMAVILAAVSARRREH